MANQRFVSPGVFTKENDLSFLPQGIAEIGGAFVGLAREGPAFVPTIIESPNEFRKIFGDEGPEFYVAQAAISYLQDAARATIVRILGLDGYDQDTSDLAVLTIASGSDSNNELPVAVIFPTRNTQDVTPVAIASASIGPNSGSRNFDLTLTNDNGVTSTLTGLSLLSTDSGYYVNALGEGPGGSEVGYVILNFNGHASGVQPGSASTQSFANTVGARVNIWHSSVSGSVNDVLMLSGSTFGVYSNASTPWVQSQTIGGKKHNLFKVHTFTDGNAANRSIKVAVASTRPAPSTATDQHGKFSLVVRAFDDTDSKLSILETFENLSLDPDSPDYIARRIGDQYWQWDSTQQQLVLQGDWPSNSDYIYIEAADGIADAPDTVLPAGFAAVSEPVDFTPIGLTISSSTQPVYVTTRFEVPTGGSEAVENTRRYYGWAFENAANNVYLNPVPSGALSIGSAFSLEDLTGNDLDVAQAVSSGTVTGASTRKFAIPLQGGFDGLNPSRVIAVDSDIAATNTQGFDLSLSTSPGSKAYKRAIDILSNDEVFDINLLILPGVLRQYHTYVTQLAIDMCENRGDCFYIMDGFAFGSTVNNAINTIAGIDTNYAAVYHPWVKILDVSTNRNIWVPPSVVMPQVFAFNDKVGAEWFAPAGLNRGGVSNAVQVETRLARAQRDDLYDGRVNPIALFPGQGTVAWGQKTLQQEASALDRINVRRLLIAVKKFIASASRFLVFEQNVDATRQRFLNIANPFLASIQERNGLFAFKVIMDESNNSPDLIDRNILVGQIYLQPTRTAEFISLEFNILPTGATFPEGA